MEVWKAGNQEGVAAREVHRVAAIVPVADRKVQAVQPDLRQQLQLLCPVQMPTPK